MSALKNINISKALFDETVPSTSQKVKITPFRVGDEKVLLMASESGDAGQMANSLRQVVDNCVEGVETPLSFFDYEYLFIKLRSISVGETADIQVKCTECEHMNPTKVDLSKVQVEKNPNHTRTVKVNDNLGFAMKYPDIEEAVKLNLDKIEGILDLISMCVSTVYHGEESINIGPMERSDLREILEGLTSQQFKSFQNFFETMPKLRETIEFNCEKCSHHNKQILEGLQSFF